MEHNIKKILWGCIIFFNFTSVSAGNILLDDPEELSKDHLVIGKTDEVLFQRSLKTNQLKHEAESLLETKQYDLAIKRYKDIIEIQPDSLDVILALAQISSNLKNHEESVKYYLALLEKSPYESLVYLDNLLEEIKLVLVTNSDYNINQTFEKLAKLYENNASIFAVLSAFLISIEKYDLALLYADKAIQLDDTNPVYRYNQAIIYDKLNDFHKAYSAYNMFLRYYNSDLGTSVAGIDISAVRNRAEYLRRIVNN